MLLMSTWGTKKKASILKGRDKETGTALEKMHQGKGRVLVY